MRPNKFTMTSTGVSAWIPVDYRCPVFSLHISVDITGAPTYSIEFTVDNIYEDTAPTIHKYQNQDYTSKVLASISSPIFAYRINFSAGTGTVTTSSLQASG